MKNWTQKKKRLIIIIFIMALCGTWFGTRFLYSRLRFSKAQIFIPSGVKFNFETQEPGRLVTHDFEITNIGKQVVKIEKVIPNCSCSVASLDKWVIKPGESAKMNIRLDTTGLSGHINKKVVVITNPRSSEMIQLEMIGKVNFAWAPASKFINFEYSKEKDAGNIKYSKFEIANTRTEQKAILVPRINTVPEYLDVKISPQNDKLFIVSVGLDVEKAPLKFNRHILLDSDNQTFFPFKLAIQGRSRDGYISYPNIIYLGIVETGKEYFRQLKIRCLENNRRVQSNDFKIVEVLPKNIANIVVKDVEEKADNSCTVNLIVKPNIPAKIHNTKIEGEIRFTTGTGKYFEIPLCYYII